MQCLILAGGFHRRVYSLIGDKPKALLEYRGKPLLTHIVERIPADIEILITTNQKFENCLADWKNSIRRPVEVLIESAVSEEQKLGALSAIDFWVREKQIEEDLLVIGGDNYFEFEIERFLQAFDGQHALVALHDIGDLNLARNFGVVSLTGNKIREFVEKPLHPVSTVIATACYIFPPRVLEILREYCSQGKKDLLGSFLAYLVTIDEVRAFIFTERWFDIGNELMNQTAEDSLMPSCGVEPAID